jgi:hypothetical protein
VREPDRQGKEMSKKNPANTKKTRDEKGRWIKGAPSPNAAGRPKDGESWAGIIKQVGDMYAEDLLSFIGKDNDLGRAIVQYPKGVQLKYLITARAFASLMFEPSSGLLNALMERAEGKVPQIVSGDGDNGEIVVRLIKDE